MASVPSTFFDEHTSLRAVIEACLQGMAGDIRTVREKPGAARLDLGCYAVLGGDPQTDDALPLIESIPAGMVLVYAGTPWKRRVLSVFPDAVDAPMITFVPGPDQCDVSRAFAEREPTGYRIRPLTPGDVMPDGLTPNGFQVFAQRVGFHRYGFGVVATRNGTIVAQTTTYAVSRDKAEIAIATDAGHRGKGLAGCLAAAMLCECAARGLEPHWSASNPISQRLARRLGFLDNDICHVLTVPRSHMPQV